MGSKRCSKTQLIWGSNNDNPTFPCRLYPRVLLRLRCDVMGDDGCLKKSLMQAAFVSWWFYFFQQWRLYAIPSASSGACWLQVESGSVRNNRGQ